MLSCSDRLPILSSQIGIQLLVDGSHVIVLLRPLSALELPERMKLTAEVDPSQSRSDVAKVNPKAVGELEAETFEEVQCIYSGEAKHLITL